MQVSCLEKRRGRMGKGEQELQHLGKEAGVPDSLNSLFTRLTRILPQGMGTSR